MADRTEALVLQMSADITRMTKALNQARGQTDRQLGLVEKRFDRMNNHIRRSQDDIARDLRTSIAAIGAAFAVRDLANAADQWTNLRNQVRQYADVVGPVDEATSRLVTVANDAGVAVGALGTTFAASARAAGVLGASAEQVFTFNEAVAKGAAIANTGAAALDGALTQLGQSIGSPVVQLGEFNSVIEGTPRLAQAFADGIAEAEGSVAKLRQLISSGEISGQELFQGLISQVSTLRKEFSESETTISRSLNRLGNAFVQYVGNADRANGVTQQLSGFIDVIANNFDTLADAAIIAAGVLGGTLAAGAIVRLIAGLGTLRTAMASTAGAMSRLQLATAFLTGPLAATVLAIGAALVTMGLSAADAGSAADRAADSLEKLGKIRDDITSQTAQLQAAQEKLNEAIRNGGEAARISSALELDRIRKLLEGNRALFQLERARAQQALNDRSADFRKKYVDIPGLQSRGFGRTTLESADFNILAPELRRRGQSVDEFSTAIGDAARLRGLTDEEKLLSGIAQAILTYRQEMKELTDQVKDFDKVLAETAPGAGGQALPFPTIEQGGSGGGRSLRGYRTDLESVRETMKALGEEAALDGKLLADAVASVQSLLDTDQTAADFSAKWKEANEQLGDLYEQNAQRAIERSRVGVQALLDLAAATDDVSLAFSQIPSLDEILTPEDTDLVRTKLTEVAQEGLASIATGYAEVEADFQAALAELEAKRRDAEAAGLNWLATYMAKREALESEFAARRVAVFDEQMGPIGFIPSVADETDRLPSAQSLSDDYMRPFAADAESAAELERLMTESVKNAFREGVRTGDWGDAFRAVLSDALSAGLDDALNRVADFLARELFKENGWIDAALNVAMAYFGGAGAGGGVAGARAAGGPVMAGKTYLVGERGPELVTMGGSGQVMSNSDLTGMLGSSRPSSLNIHAPLTIMGSVDAVTWPKVQEAMRQQARQIMASVPASVNATLVDNRIQKRRF